MINGRVLVIAGSDSGGGAGIQADVKTIAMLGGYAQTAITAITAQNTTGVHDVFAVPAITVGSQIRASLQDIGCDAVKLGMLHNDEIITEVAHELKALKGQPIVLDPVMVSTSGDALLNEPALKILREKLLPTAYLLTPNLPEAELLSGVFITGPEGMEKAGTLLMERYGCRAVLVKGGHLRGTDMITDLLMTEHGTVTFESPRIDSKHTHGTGCTLASAIAAGLAQGMHLREAVTRGRDYVYKAISSAPGLGTGHGPINHSWPLMRPNSA